MNSYIRDIIRDQRSGDVWGDTMAPLFSIAEVIYCLGFDVPTELQFRPSPMLSLAHIEANRDEYDCATQLLGLVDDNLVGAGELQEAARILNRYCDILKAQGRDY